MLVKTRQTCRVCGSELKDVVHFGDFVLPIYSDENDDSLITRAFPLHLTKCDNESNENGCGLLQLRHSISSDVLFKEYYYRSGINESMVLHLKSIVEKSVTMVSLENGDCVLDIGSNDGTLLKHVEDFVDFSTEVNGVSFIGFEPCTKICELAQKKLPKSIMINDFFNKDAFFKKNDLAKLITSIAMFYDLEDPNQFVSDIADILDPDGVWVVEQNYMPYTIRDGIFDTICHEHITYYSLSVMEDLLSYYDLKIVDILFNKVNGNSFQLYVKHKNSEITEEAYSRLKKAKAYEMNACLDKIDTYREFYKKISANKKKVVDFIINARANGKKILAYGASTKGSILLQFFGLNRDLIPACADRDKTKYGKKMLSGNIPIISEEEARIMKPDYFLTLPWHFIDNFIEREKEFLDGGGSFIVPLPELKIVNGK